MPRGSVPQVLDALFAGDGLADALAGTGVRLRALAADGQALAVTQAAVAADVAKPRDVLLDAAAEGTLDHEVLVEVAVDLGDLVLGQRARLAAGVDVEVVAHLDRVLMTDTI